MRKPDRFERFHQKLLFMPVRGAYKENPVVQPDGQKDNDR
jgi:hypothetical protein